MSTAKAGKLRRQVISLTDRNLLCLVEAMPEKPFGLTLFLQFFDRCIESAAAASAPRQRGAAFPRGRSGSKRLYFKRKKPPVWVAFSFGAEGGICLHFFSLAGDAKRNRGIHQCAHWFMHMPPACADMIQIPPAGIKKAAHPYG